MDAKTAAGHSAGGANSTPDQQRSRPSLQIDIEPQQQLKPRPKRKRGGLAAVGRSVTKGPRMLGRRIKHFLKDEMYVDVTFQKMPSTEATKELATMELLAIYHRWLRGVQALLSVLVFLLSLMSIPGSATFVNWTIFLLSQCTCLVISKTYHVKAQFSGVTNVLFEGRNIFTSPYFFEMVAEIILWNIQTPPIVVFWKPFFNLINYFLFVRLYSIIVYLNNAAYVYRTFCRSMAAISDLPLNTSFLIRTALVYHRYRVGILFLLSSWLSIGFMYAKAESVSVSTGMWFSFQTLATLGYGDATPITLAGRAVVIIAGVCCFFFLAYMIVCAQATLTASDAEYNMQVLARCHDLTHSMRARSARVIQIAWRLHRTRREAGPNPTRKQQLKIILISSALTHFIAALRRARQGLRAAQRDFRETTVNPLTGLSSYQYTTYVYETHRAARKLQRVKDVDRVYLALKDRDVMASALTRKDIESILMPHGAAVLEHEPVGALSSYTAYPSYHLGGGVGQGATVHMGSFYSEAGVAGGATAAEVEAWQRRVTALEERCAQLSTLLDGMAALADTHPPSMAVSQM